MPLPHSLDLRRKALDACRETGKLLETARRFNVSHDFAGGLIKLYEETGDILPKPRGGGAPQRLDAPRKKRLSHIVKAGPDLTLEEMKENFYRAWGESHPISTLDDALKRLGLTRKKTALRPADEKRESEKARCRI